MDKPIEVPPGVVVRVVDVGALAASVPSFPLPMGATPRLALMPDEPQDMGDALALDRAILEAAPQSYRYRWNAFLGSPEAA